MVFGILKLIGLAVYLYLVWRNLREDYREDDLVEFGWLSVLMMMVAGRLTYGLIHWGIWNGDILDWWYFWSKPGFEFMGAMIGWVAAVILYSRNKELKLFSFADGVWPQLAVLMVVWQLDEIVRSRFEMIGLWQILVWVVAVIVFWWGNGKYRSIGWYKSGKRGFAVMSANIVWGLAMAVVGAVAGTGWVLPVLGASWSLISVAGLVMLSRI